MYSTESLEATSEDGGSYASWSAAHHKLQRLLEKASDRSPQKSEDEWEKESGWRCEAYNPKADKPWYGFLI